jgi:hypothetical protein
MFTDPVILNFKVERSEREWVKLKHGTGLNAKFNDWLKTI